MHSLKIFSGNSNLPLAEDIARSLEKELGKAKVETFSDGETRVEIDENVRGMDVFIVQPTCRPVDVALMELLIMIDAVKRASANRITAVIPYYGYARQDRKMAPRAPITAKLVADLITKAGVNRVLAMDLHAGQIQGFFNIPVDNLYPSKVMLSYLTEKYPGEMVVVAPDAGAVERARFYAKKLKAPLAIIDKRRDEADRSRVINIIGEVAGLRAVIISDMVDTAETVAEAAAALIEGKATGVIICATHAVLSESAIARISQSWVEKVIVTDTIPLDSAAKLCDKIKVLSVSGILAKAIRRIHRDESLSSLFD
ncbi:MAG: ribose-phosphate pyrophosphokinase [Candidatus Falkowbacteria bacterium]